MSTVRGWCPDAWRPMAAGDGLLVRVRPRLGRMSRDQLLGLCEAAQRYGNGQIDMTNRANLQIRGVREAAWKPLVRDLVDRGLVDADPLRERRRAILVAPDWRPGDDTHRIAAELDQRVGELPDLPAKFGFAIDAGCAPLLGGDPGDIRIERGIGGGLILRADGRSDGAVLAPGAEIAGLIALAHWFVESGGREAGRMRRHAAILPHWAEGRESPAPSAPSLSPGRHPLGAAQGLAFGRIDAARLDETVGSTAAGAVRTTPWRILLVEGGPPAPAADWLPGVDACVGRPACPQATVETRALARRLARHVTGGLHVSGCAKGCARARPAAVMLTGRAGRYDLAFHSRADAPPVHAGLDPDHLLAHFGAA